MQKKTKIIMVIISVILLCVSCSAIYFVGKWVKDKNGGKITDIFNGGGSVVVGYNLDELDKIEDSSNWTDGKTIKLFGRVQSVEMITLFYIYADGSSMVVYNQNEETYEAKIPLDGVVNDDYVVLEGVWSTSKMGIDLQKITKVEKNKAETYLQSKVPMMEIEIIDYPESVNHVCEDLMFKLKLTNTGNVTITKDELFDYEYNYALYYFVDEDFRKSYDFDEDRGEIANLGLKDFEKLDPGESIEIDFGGGGKVVATYYSDLFEDDGSNRLAGGSGEHNMFSGKATGAHSVKFAWVQDRDDFAPSIQPVFLFETLPVSINLQSQECDTKDVDEVRYTSVTGN